MSELAPPPAGSKIQIELSGDTLQVVIPGRWTMSFWFMVLGALVYTGVATGFRLSLSSPTNPIESWFLQIMPFWGVLCFVWFFFVFKARTETVILAPGFVETRGSFLIFVSRRMLATFLEGFVLKPVGPEHLWQGILGFQGYNGRKLLFATAPSKGWGQRDLPLAIQAEDAELEWLRGVLESHWCKLQPGAQRQP